MATIAHKIIKADGTAHATRAVYFCPRLAVVTAAGGVSAAPISKTTDSSGNFSVTLQPGQYWVRWRWANATIPDEIGITVPTGSATYSLSDLADEEVDLSMVITSIQGIAALRAETSYFNNQVILLSYLSSENDGQGGWFEYDSSSTSDDDGVDVIKPSAIDSADPGRWLRKVYA